MIVLPFKQLVIVNPPHTASRCLHEALCCPSYGAYWIVGPWLSIYDVDQHCMRIPKEWRHFSVALVIRNPFDRLIGLWLHYKWASDNGKIDFGFRGMIWKEFIRAVVTEDRNKLTPFFRWTISHSIEILHKINKYIRYEYLQDDIDKLVGEPIKLGQPYHEKNDIYTYYIDNNMRSCVNAWAQPDLLNFGYEPLCLL